MKQSGSLDLAKEPMTAKNYADIRITPQNVGEDYTYDNKKGLSLVGEYSNYFQIYYYTTIPGGIKLGRKRIRRAN